MTPEKYKFISFSDSVVHHKGVSRVESHRTNAPELMPTVALDSVERRHEGAYRVLAPGVRAPAHVALRVHEGLHHEELVLSPRALRHELLEEGVVGRHVAPVLRARGLHAVRRGGENPIGEVVLPAR